MKCPWWWFLPTLIGKNNNDNNNNKMTMMTMMTMVVITMITMMPLTHGQLVLLFFGT